MSAQYHTLGLGHIQTCRSGPKVAVFHAKTSSEACDPQRLVILVLKSLFCIHKTTGDGWNPYRLDILVLSTPLCVLNTTDYVWDPHRLVSLVLKSLFCMHRTTGECWNPHGLVILVLTVLNAQNHSWGLGLIETSNSGAYQAVAVHKTTSAVWDP